MTTRKILVATPTAPIAIDVNSSAAVSVTLSGARGANGYGVPVGGDAGAVLAKSASGDYLTTWLATTAFGRGLLALVDAAGARTAIGLGSVDNTADTAKPVSTAQAAAIAAAVAAEAGTRAAADTAINDTLATKTDGWVNGLIAAAVGSVTQAYSATLTALAGLTTTAFGRSVLTLADAAALRTAVSLPTSTVAGRLARYTDTAGAQGSTTGLFEDANGNVGIGTSAPSQKLEVAGHIKTTGGNLLVDTGAAALAQIGLNGDIGSFASLFNIRSTGSIPIAFSTGSTLGTESVTGSERMRIDSSGNVGIGTTNPSVSLHVVSSGPLRLERSGSGRWDFNIVNPHVTGDTTDLVINAGVAASGFGIVTRNTGGTQINALAINKDGNVGIGTTAPASVFGLNRILEIGGASVPGLRLNSSSGANFEIGAGASAGYMWTTGASSVSIGTNNTHRLFVDASGNVGIGTTTPGELLDVRGNSGANTGVLVKNDGAGRALLRLDSGGTSTTNMVFARGGVDKWSLQANDGYNFAIIDNTAAAYRFLVDASGNVGIGTTAPRVKLDVSGPVAVGSYTVATVPSAALGAGQIIYVSNESGGATLAASDATNWRRTSDNAIIS